MILRDMNKSLYIIRILYVYYKVKGRTKEKIKNGLISMLLDDNKNKMANTNKKPRKC